MCQLIGVLGQPDMSPSSCGGVGERAVRHLTTSRRNQTEGCSTFLEYVTQEKDAAICKHFNVTCKPEESRKYACQTECSLERKFLSLLPDVDADLRSGSSFNISRIEVSHPDGKCAWRGTLQ